MEQSKGRPILPFPASGEKRQLRWEEPLRVGDSEVWVRVIIEVLDPEPPPPRECA
jgi:hypothetical protein